MKKTGLVLFSARKAKYLEDLQDKNIELIAENNV